MDIPAAGFQGRVHHRGIIVGADAGPNGAMA
jgi:hypothetical protein